VELLRIWLDGKEEIGVGISSGEEDEADETEAERERVCLNWEMGIGSGLVEGVLFG
jgi:hypothetical protein